MFSVFKLINSLSFDAVLLWPSKFWNIIEAMWKGEIWYSEQIYFNEHGDNKLDRTELKWEINGREGEWCARSKILVSTEVFFSARVLSAERDRVLVRRHLPHQCISFYLPLLVVEGVVEVHLEFLAPCVLQIPLWTYMRILHFKTLQLLWK